VAPHVELLDLIAGEISAAGVAELIAERGVGQLLRDDGGTAPMRPTTADMPRASEEPRRAC
jgi:hypothetical protein